MPALGFGSTVGSRLPDLANFPSDGLVALYKCDERTGDRLADATGNLEPVRLYTGVALDCTTNTQSVADGTSLHSDFSGADWDAIVGFEIITPALVSTGTTHRIVTGSTTSNAPIHIWLSELAFTTGNAFGFGVRTRVSVDGGATASRDLNTAVTTLAPMAPSTAYQCLLRFYVNATNETRIQFMFRKGTDGAWTSYDGEAGADFTTSCTFVAAAAFQLLNSSANPFKGHVSSVFIAKAMPLSAAINIMDRPDTTNVQNVLADYTSRYWQFRNGAGSNAQELKTDAAVGITGTVTWAGALAGVTQSALRQGLPYYGKPGLVLGGESGHAVGTGYGASAVNASPVIGNPDGWTVMATLRVGNRVPATDQFLFSVFGPQEDGSYSTTPTLQPGVHIVLDDTGLMRGVIKRSNIATGAAQTGGEVALGASPESAANGLFGTYAITCDATGLVSMKRVITGDTSVTTQGTVTAGINNLNSRATRVGFGNASFGADVRIGFGAIYARALTDAEIMQCHKSSLSRMKGEELWVLAAAAGGNGTELYPYSDTLPALRVHQPSQICNWGTGSYTRFNQSASSTAPSSSSNITWRGTGSPTFGPGAALGGYPTILQDGSWTFSGIVWDANDAAYYAMTVSQDVESVSFTNCEWKNGHQWVDGVDPGGGSTATGSGLTSRAALTTIINCTATDNDEHGVYLRIVGEGAADQRCVIDGLTVSGCAEDGLKMTNEGAYGARWRNCIINRVKVTGGKNQLYLLGLSDSVVTNFLLLDQTSVLTSIAPLYLGNVQAFTGETLTADYPLVNVTVANGTISNSNVRGVWIKGDLASGSVTIRNIVCKDCPDDYNDDTTAGTVTISHCAGDTAGDPFPAGTGMIPGATIAFTNAAGGDYTLTALSDGYGDGVNLTGLSDEAESTYAGVARPTTGAWNMGAY